MQSENIWLLWSKPSNYQDKLRCHARDEKTEEDESGKSSSVLIDQKPQQNPNQRNYSHWYV